MLANSKEEKRERDALDSLEGSDVQTLERALKFYGAFHAEEEDRKKGVEARLASVLSLASLVAAVLFGFSTVFEKGSASRYGWMGWLGTLVLLYAVAQLLFSVWQAIGGLKVQLITELAPADVLPAPNEKLEAQLLRSLEIQSESLKDHDRVNSSKHDFLERAHRGILNFLLGISVLVCLLAVMAIQPSSPTATPESVVERLRTDGDFIQRLRGSAGPPGPAGPAGLAGQAPSLNEVMLRLQTDTAFLAQLRALCSEAEPKGHAPVQQHGRP